MPNRVIRESLLDSDRYWHCTIEARELYRHIQLLADDFGCLPLSHILLKRRCFESPPTPDKLLKLLGELVDNDLLRRYEASGGVYGFIPRFRQRMQRMSLKHPKPPPELYADDDHAIELFNTIKDKTAIPTVGQQMAISSPSDCPPLKGKERKVKEKTKPLGSSVEERKRLESSFNTFWKTYPIKRGEAEALAQWMILKPDDALVAEILSKVSVFKETNDWKKENGKYIVLGWKFIKFKRWKDDMSDAPRPHHTGLQL